jgi:hypothetical protein
LTSMSRRKESRQFAVCVQNTGYKASLELGKIYQVLPDEKAAKHKLVRVVDESKEDYLYPRRFFVAIDVPDAVEKVLLAS